MSSVPTWIRSAPSTRVTSTSAGGWQRGLTISAWANPFRFAYVGRDQAVDAFKQHLEKSQILRQIGSLEGLQLVCHCRADERCHADVFIDKYVETFPGCYDLRKDVHPPPERVVQVAADAGRERELDASSRTRSLSHRIFGMGGLVRGSPFGSARLREAGTFVKEEACARQAVGGPTRACFPPLLCGPPSLNLSRSWPYGSAPSTRSRRCGSARWCSPQSSLLR